MGSTKRCAAEGNSVRDYGRKRNSGSELTGTFLVVEPKCMGEAQLWVGKGT